MIAILRTAGPEFRVAQIQSPENFIDADFSDKSIEAMFVYTFGMSKIYTNINDAILYANLIMDGNVFIEYGIGAVDYPDIDFNTLMTMEQVENLK